MSGKVGNPDGMGKGKDLSLWEALEQGHGEFRDIPHLFQQRKGQSIEASWEEGVTTSI
jgi:hypothetical protein